MKTLEKANASHLLEAGIEALHSQSMEWLEDIAFWRDEAAFLYALEMRKTLISVPVDAKNKIQKIENELVKISGGDLDNLYNEVEKHEHYLDEMLESKREDEEEYREKHKQIADKVNTFEKRFRKLKKEIFDLVKEHKAKLTTGVSGK